MVVIVVVVVAAAVVVKWAANTLIESQGAERSAAPERSPVTAAAHITFHPAQAGAQFNASPFCARCVPKHAKYYVLYGGWRGSIFVVVQNTKRRHCRRHCQSIWGFFFEEGGAIVVNVEEDSSPLLEGITIIFIFVTE